MNTGTSIRSSFLLALLAVLLLAPISDAYEYPAVERGFKPERVFQVGEIDQVQLFNGGLSVTIPIGQSYPVGLGSELSYGLTLVYGSHLWDHGSVQAPTWSSEPYYIHASPVRGTNAGFGWRLSLGEFWYDTTVFGPQRCDNCYVSPAGARHRFYQTLFPDVPDDSTSTMYTRDGSLLRLRTITGGREIDFPNGDIHKFDGVGRLVQMRDRLGNWVNVAYTATTWTISDSHGRTHTVNLVSVPHYGTAVGSVILKTFGGTQTAYSFSYANATVPRSCLDTDPDTSATMILPLLTGVALPDGSTYAMPTTSYDLNMGYPCTADHSAPKEGLLQKVKLPTRGSVEWAYAAYNFPVTIEGDNGEQPPWLQKVAGVWTRTLRTAAGTAIGTWTYDQSLPGGQSAVESITSVSTPLGDKTEHYFRVGSSIEPAYGLPYSPVESAPGRADLLRSTKTYDCDTLGGNCLLRRTTYVKYKTDSLNPSHPEFNPRVEATYTRFHDDGDRWLASDLSSYDGLGHHRTETFSGNFGSGDSRTTTTNFNSTRGTYPGSFVMPSTASPWVLDTYDHRSVVEGGKTFHSDFCFDGSTGFLLRSRTRKSTLGAIGGNDLVTTFTRTAASQTIAERHYGGDLVALGTTSLCALSLGTDGYRLDHTFQYGSLQSSQFSTTTGAAVLKTVDRTIDLNTGFAASERDPAGVTTTYSYDVLGRLTQVMPAEDAWVAYTYVAPISGNAAVRVRRYRTGMWTSELTDEELTFDDFGRLWMERRRTPSGTWARRTTLYDALSQVSDVSEWQGDFSNTMWNRFRSFDPFGRPGYLDPPEGSTHRVSFAYAGDRVVSRTAKVGTLLNLGVVNETPVTVTDRFDRQGRLHQVVDGTGTTTYGYDPAGRLTSVVMPGQSRTFSYDGRGFLTSEKHPEKGVSGNGTVGYSRYDARGNVGSRSDGPMSVDYVFDRAGRVLQVKAPTGELLKVFSYGSGTVATDRSLGKVKTADRYNYVLVGTTPYTAQVRETYTYGGRSGRVSRRDTQTWVNGALGDSYTQSFTSYDHLGNLSSLTYPQCTHASCAAPAPRSVSFGFSDGRVTSVPGWASSITYHPNGLMASVTHANGVSVTQTNDGWARPRPKAIATTGAYDPSGTILSNWSTGNYTYDGSGNVINIGSGRFVYDNLSRLTSASLTTNISGTTAIDTTQSYVYDAVGNLTSTNTNGASVGSSASPSTNRLTGVVSYDAAGNLVSWIANTYDYDRLGMMWRMRSGSIEDVHIYTADDERIWTFHLGLNASTWTLRDLSGKVLREYANNAGVWSVTRDYVYRDDQLLAAATPSGVHHFHLDHLGTPRLITNALGRRVAYHAYYPYGQEATSPTLDTERMKFTGHERDLNATTGTNPAADDLDYMHARFYNPQPGRFLSVDQGKDWNPGIPQSWNLYSYTRGNPLKYVDPDGQAVETVWDVINVGLGVASLVDNVRGGHYGSAALDAGGLLYDGFATAVPFLPGGAGAAIKASRAADAVVTVSRSADVASSGRRVTSEALTAARREFNAVTRPAFWKQEAARNAANYSPENLRRMAKGKAPIGPDGNPMELHHKKPLSQGGTNSFDNLEPLTRTQHRLGENFRKRHPNGPPGLGAGTK